MFHLILVIRVAWALFAASDEPAGPDKRKFIEEILAADLEAAGGGGGHGESLVEDDEALNELMARDEAEFKRLQVCSKALLVCYFCLSGTPEHSIRTCPFQDMDKARAALEADKYLSLQAAAEAAAEATGESVKTPGVAEGPKVRGSWRKGAGSSGHKRGRPSAAARDSDDEDAPRASAAASSAATAAGNADDEDEAERADALEAEQALADAGGSRGRRAFGSLLLVQRSTCPHLFNRCRVR